MPTKRTSPFRSGSDLKARMPPVCARASIMRTPGMMGFPGKWPGKKGSLKVTFFMPTIRFNGSYSVTRSTRRKG